MPVSSNSLFHFTNSADHLFNILKNNFGDDLKQKAANLIKSKLDNLDEVCMNVLETLTTILSLISDEYDRNEKELSRY